MDFFRRHAALFWALAFLLWAGTGVAHTSALADETHCEVACTTGELPDAPVHPQPDSSASHCCHAFSPGNLPPAICAVPPRCLRLSAWLSLAPAAAPDAPAREIDHPPQLS